MTATSRIVERVIIRLTRFRTTDVAINARSVRLMQEVAQRLNASISSLTIEGFNIPFRVRRQDGRIPIPSEVNRRLRLRQRLEMLPPGIILIVDGVLTLEVSRVEIPVIMRVPIAYEAKRNIARALIVTPSLSIPRSRDAHRGFYDSMISVMQPFLPALVQLSVVPATMFTGITGRPFFLLEYATANRPTIYIDLLASEARTYTTQQATQLFSVTQIEQSMYIALDVITRRLRGRFTRERRSISIADLPGDSQSRLVLFYRGRI